MLFCLIVLLALYRCTYIPFYCITNIQTTRCLKDLLPQYASFVHYDPSFLLLVILLRHHILTCESFLNISRISATVIILNLDSTYNLIRTKLYGIFKVDYRWTIFLMTQHLYYLSIIHTFCHNAIPQKMQPKLVFGINER